MPPKNYALSQRLGLVKYLQGAYIFTPNVVLKALRLVNSGACFHKLLLIRRIRRGS